MMHRSLLYDAFEDTGLSTVHAVSEISLPSPQSRVADRNEQFLVHALSYLCGLYELDPIQSDSTPAEISARARDIVWMLACACTVGGRTIEDASPSRSQVIDSEALISNLAATLAAIASSNGSSASLHFVADGLRLTTLGVIHQLDRAEIGDADIGIRLYALLAESKAKDDILAYLLDGKSRAFKCNKSFAG